MLYFACLQIIICVLSITTISRCQDVEPPGQINTRPLENKMDDLVEFYNTNHGLLGDSIVESCYDNHWFDMRCFPGHIHNIRMRQLGSTNYPVKHEYVYSKPDILDDELQCGSAIEECTFTRTTKNALEVTTKEAIKLSFNEKLEKYVVKVDFKQEYSLETTTVKKFETTYTETYKIKSGQSCRPIISYLLIKTTAWAVEQNADDICGYPHDYCPRKIDKWDWKEIEFYTPVKGVNGNPVSGKMCVDTNTDNNYNYNYNKERLQFRVQNI
ncbi:hypothetical protein BJ944DRAFT_261598 [Cunninghamella echinulata]|nr:hypothetical protein BJ944DRAFT_261598 [Cunninghamella echinulata]